MKTFPFKTLITLVLSISVTAQTVGVGTAIIGFDLSGSEKQLALEAKFAAGLKRENLREWMKRLSARPHHLGSAYGKENAEFMASLFRSWGYDAKTERFDVLFPTPKTRLLEMTSPTKFVAKLEEPSIAEDSTSGQKSEQLPTYNAFSVGGDVTGDVVYVNYGVPADYEELARRGISVKGKIALARYGGSWRGIKPKVAAENGAIACLIYSDPKDDGFFNGDVYPVGAWRNKDGVQRGSVVDVPVATGDPSTPGYGSVPGAKRLSVPEIETITKIPVMPISYGDAEPILRSLSGPVAPAAWRGALPITYKLGGQDALKVRFKIDFNWNVVPLYNVIAKLEGSEFPDEWIIRGNHHDAWVNGASDPLSGAVAELDEARAIGELAKKGWRPRRTIIYAMWDGEEQGLIGSTEWVETHAEELSKKAAVYINTDSVGRGYLGMGGSHSLERFINEVAKSVKDPVHGISVWDRARARQLADGGGARDLSESGDMKIGALGSGSD
ncbi:MAG: M28 family peptidase, partial [Acidobacteriota bacterium]